MIEGKDLVNIGFLFKPHGFKGEINAVLDYPVETFKDHNIPFILSLDGIYVPFFYDGIRSKGEENCLIRFEGVYTETEVSKLVNHEIYALKRDMANLLGVDESELAETASIFIGAKIIDDINGSEIGIVTDIEEGKEYDYLVIETLSTKDTVSIPFIDAFITEIDDEQDPAVIRVSLPEGLLEINEDPA